MDEYRYIYQNTPIKNVTINSNPDGTHKIEGDVCLYDTLSGKTCEGHLTIPRAKLNDANIYIELDNNNAIFEISLEDE
jgi:hypothetical protein